MIPGKIVDNQTGEKLPFTIPSNWGEVTFWQLLQLERVEPSAVAELSILSGVEYRIWADVDSIGAAKWYNKLTKALNPLECPDWAELAPVFSIQLGDKEIELPKNINKVPAGAAETISEIIRAGVVLNEAGDVESADISKEDIVFCFALLCVKPYYGIYGDDGEDKATKLIELIKQAPAVIIYPTINFFFEIWKKKKKSGVNVWEGITKILR